MTREQVVWAFVGKVRARGRLSVYRVKTSLGSALELYVGEDIERVVSSILRDYNSLEEKGRRRTDRYDVLFVEEGYRQRVSLGIEMLDHPEWYELTRRD